MHNPGIVRDARVCAHTNTAPYAITRACNASKHPCTIYLPTHRLFVFLNERSFTKVDPSGGEPRALAHNELLRDAAQGGPGLLEFDPTVTERLLGSSRSEGCLLGTSKPPRQATYVVRAFRTKLQQVPCCSTLSSCPGFAGVRGRLPE